MKLPYIQIIWGMTVSEFFKEDYNLLRVEDKQSSPQLGGNLITLRKITIRRRVLGIIPLFSQEIQYYWNPMKRFIRRELFTANEWGDDSSLYIKEWIRLSEPIGGNIELLPSYVKIHNDFKATKEVADVLNVIKFN